MNENNIPPRSPGDAPGDEASAPPKFSVPPDRRPFWCATTFFVVALFLPPVFLIIGGCFGDPEKRGQGGIGFIMSGMVIMPISSAFCALRLGGGLKGKSFWRIVGILLLIPVIWLLSLFLGFVGCMQVDQYKGRHHSGINGRLGAPQFAASLPIPPAPFIAGASNRRLVPGGTEL